MNAKVNTLLFTLILILTACGNSSNKVSGTADVVYEPTQLEDKVFKLDDETSVDGIQAQYTVIDGVGYYSFFNRPNRHIYFYNYKTGEIAYKVKLDDDGPNAVLFPYYSFTFWVHDFDNIFINTMQFYYRINKEGEVLNRTMAHQMFSFSDDILVFDGSTSYKNGKLYSSNSKFVNQKGDTSWLRAIFDFEKGEVEKYYLDERIILPDFEEKAEKVREMAKTGGVSSLSFHFAGSDQQLYASSAINDSLHYFEGTKQIKTYFAGNPEVPSTDLEGFFTKSIITRSDNGVSIRPNPTQPAYFYATFSSLDKQLIYRILVHGTKPIFDPEMNEEQPKIFGASLIVFDTKTKKSGMIDLPIELIEQVDLTNSFVTEEGIHFAMAEAKSENEKAYKVIKIDKL